MELSQRVLSWSSADVALLPPELQRPMWPQIAEEEVRDGTFCAYHRGWAFDLPPKVTMVLPRKAKKKPAVNKTMPPKMKYDCVVFHFYDGIWRPYCVCYRTREKRHAHDNGLHGGGSLRVGELEGSSAQISGDGYEQVGRNLEKYADFRSGNDSTNLFSGFCRGTRWWSRRVHLDDAGVNHRKGRGKILLSYGW